MAKSSVRLDLAATLASHQEKVPCSTAVPEYVTDCLQSLNGRRRFGEGGTLIFLEDFSLCTPAVVSVATFDFL